MHLKRLLNTSLGKFFISVLLGLGLATLFRKVCTDKNCISFNGPVISDIDNKIYKYGEKCYKKGWNVDIPNKELVKKAYELYMGKNVQFIHIRAHTNNTDIHSIGNDSADKLANMAIGLEKCPYVSIQ